jgi:MYXO-CTERM domain-containing protein
MKHRIISLGTALACALTFAPAVASACGGLFCDNAQPINQAAERIVFAREGDTMHMIVRLTYQGPPQEFGWLLPVPDDVETAVSSEQLFATLDALYAPVFRLTTVIDDACLQAQAANGNFDAGSGGFADSGPAPGPEVQVLSREAVGPYDRVILQAATVGALTDWLDENSYQVPEGAEATLKPYVDLGLAFVALKLLPGADSNDVVPLHLTFTGDSPAVPLRPTAVAAEPDMGIIVHLLGQARAVPTNFAHVTINEAAIDWRRAGQNYSDVVSQAADEADGHAFVTDFAGPAAALNLPTLDAQTVEAIGATQTFQALNGAMNLFGLDADLQRILSAAIEAPEGLSTVELLQCPDCYGDQDIPVDGAAIAAAIEAEYNAPRRQIAGLFEANPYLTRLYTTLSPAEMDRDPIFGFNVDLEGVDNTHRATQHVSCGDDDWPDFDNAVIELANGQRVANQGEQVIQRQDGATVRGIGVQAAALIEQQHATGQPDTIDDRRGEMDRTYADPLPGGGSTGCDCDTTDGAPGPVLLVLGLGLLVLRRRR